MRALLLSAAVALAGCPEDNSATWQIVHEELPGALTSVWGSSENDVWAVGGDPDATSSTNGPLGPTVLHFDGERWELVDTGEQGDLWWVFGFAGGPVYMGGAGGQILRYQDGTFTRMATPGMETVFGIWGPSPSDVWAVGGAYGGARGGFAWKLEGEAWVAAPGFPAGLVDTAAIWKIFGRGPNDVWLVGTDGLVVHWDGQGFVEDRVGPGESLFTVHANAERFAAVGGFGGGLLLEHDGSEWVDRSPQGSSGIVGVCLTQDGGVAVGWFGEVHERRDGVWTPVELGFNIDRTLHSVWVDPTGGIWAVGGDVLTFPLISGVMLHWGDPVPAGGS